MRPYLFVALALLAVASATCPNARVLDCPLPGSPQNLILKQQTFCPNPDTSSGLERQGLSCASLQSCCSSYSHFDSKEGFRTIGVQYEITDSGAMLVPAGKKVRLEFVRETCLGELEISTQGVQSQEDLKMVLYYEKGLLQADKGRAKINLGHWSVDSTVWRPNQDETSLCHLMALDIHAPKDAAILVKRADLCLLDAQLDICGVCNGNGQSCQESRASAQMERRQGGRRLLTVSDTTAPVAGGGGAATAGPRPTEGVVPSDWVDEACTEAAQAVIPSVYCHTQLTDSTCLTVFGFCNPNDYAVYISAGSSNNYFIRNPMNRGQNSLFVSGCEASSFAINWNCTS